jgi:sugar phosphate isomerase/epimerase
LGATSLRVFVASVASSMAWLGPVAVELGEVRLAVELHGDRAVELPAVGDFMARIPVGVGLLLDTMHVDV